MVEFTVYEVPAGFGRGLVARLMQHEIWFAVQPAGDYIRITIHPEDHRAMRASLGSSEDRIAAAISTTADAPGVPMDPRMEAGSIWVEKGWDISDAIQAKDFTKLTARQVWVPFALNGLVFAWKILTRRERAIIVQCVHKEKWENMLDLRHEIEGKS